MSTNDRTIIVMGLGQDGKPRAASYRGEMAAVAQKDAAVWNLAVGKAETEAALALAKDLPSGELFPSAKMELPTIKRETFDLLLKAVRWSGDPNAKQPKSPEQANSLWNVAITVGSTVLAFDRESGGYFPANVEKISADGKSLTCSWDGHPKIPHFTARRLAVGLLPMVKK
jgi:hypothetical protein